MSVEPRPLVQVRYPAPLLRWSPLRFLLELWDRIPTFALASSALGVLLAGILCSALFSEDGSWWHGGFSELGAAKSSTALIFNGGLQLGGILVVIFGLRVSRELWILGPRAGRRGGALLALVSFVAIGVNLSLVGIVPMDTDRDLHDRVAGSMVLAFLALLLLAPVVLHRLPRRLILATGAVLLWMGGAIWLFLTATVNLTVFELLGSAAMFGWTGVLLSALHHRSESARGLDRSASNPRG